MRSAIRRVALASISSSVASKPEAGAAGDSFPMFNYATRKLEASLRSAPDLQDVEVQVLDFRTKEVDHLVESIMRDNPDLVGLSAFVWSLPTLVDVAERIKQIDPEICVVIGGPSARPAMLNLSPFHRYRAALDGIAVGEGEETIRAIVRHLQAGADSLEGVAGISTSDGGPFLDVPSVTVDDLEAYGSVYRQGLVDARSFAYIESFRGCPLSCSFCQWGGQGDGSRRIFSKEYLVEEFQAIKEAGATDAFLLDAALNLNPRAFRNLAAAEEEVGLLSQANLGFELYPNLLQPAHLEFLQNIRPAHIGIGVQSLDLGVLKSLDRPFKVERLRQIVEQLAQTGQVNLEIIMGLPGDSPESFRATLAAVREFPAYIRVYRCLVLPDALLTRAPEGLEMDFDPVTLAMRSCTGWTEEDFERESAYVGELSTELDPEYTVHDTWWLIPPRSGMEHQDSFTPRALTLDSASEPQADRRQSPDVASPPLPQLSPEVSLELAALLEETCDWKFEGLTQDVRRCVMRLSTPDGPFLVSVEQDRPDLAAYCRAEGLALSYVSQAATPSQLEGLEKALHDHAGALTRFLNAWKRTIAGPIQHEPVVR